MKSKGKIRNRISYSNYIMKMKEQDQLKRNLDELAEKYLMLIKKYEIDKFSSFENILKEYTPEKYDFYGVYSRLTTYLQVIKSS